MWWTNSLCTSANEDLGTLAEYDPLTGYEPNDFHISETTEPYIQESSGENGSLNDLEYDDVTIGIALSSPLITQEREDDASRGRAYHSHDDGLSSSQSSSSVGHRKRDLREAHEKSLNEMEELKRFQGSTFDTISRRKLVEDRDTILELTSKIQELQNEINCMNDPRDFQDTESVRSGQSHVASQPVFFPPHPDPGGMLSRSLGMPNRKNGPPSIWDTHGISGNVFANPTASSSAPYPQESNPWSSSNVSEHTSPHVMSESQTPVQDQRCQSGQSARNSVIPCEGDFSKNYGQTNNDGRFQVLILTNSPRQQHSLVGR